MNQRIESSTDRLRDQAAALTDDMHKLGTVTKDMAREYVDQGREKVDDLAKHLSSYVRQQPVKCLAMAAGAGILFGYMFLRRR